MPGDVRNVPRVSRAVKSTIARHPCRACVIIEKPAEALTTANPTAAIDGRRGVNEFVAEPLVIPLLVIVRNELCDRLDRGVGLGLAVHLGDPRWESSTTYRSQPVMRGAINILGRMGNAVTNVRFHQ